MKVGGLRNDPEHHLVVDYSEHYYYHRISEKMRESLSISNCTMSGDYTDGLANMKDEYDLYVKVVPPPNKVIAKWSDKNYYKAQTRIFAHVTENLCNSPRFKDLVKGFYKRAKGCYKVYIIDKNGIKQKRLNTYGATLHPEHVRCDNQVASSICHQGGTSGLQVIDRQYRRLNSYPFVISAKRVVIGRGGMFGLPCGPFGLFSSCEAVKWGVPFANDAVKYVEGCRTGRDCPFPKYNKVFVMTQYDDTQIGQFMQEALPKLIYHLEYLQAHPDVKIHYGFTKQSSMPTFVLPHYFFFTFGLLDRLINGTTYANEIIMPREGGCQDIGYNAWEAVTMREKFYNMIGIQEKADFTRKVPYQPTILILTRSAGKFTQNKADYNVRRWTKEQLDQMVPALQERFPQHAIELFSDVNATLMKCPLCQAEVFSRADIVIGHHGAGLSNAIFMKPGGVMIEVVYNYDSRHAPILGIFPRMADIVGLHHFMYYIRDIEFTMPTFVKEVADFVKKAKLWA